MNGGLRFSVPELSVAHQALDGEVVIVHLTRGHYYSLSEAGADAWTAIAAGSSLDDVVATLALRYDAEHDVLVAAVDDFVQGLLAEGLIEGNPAADSESAVVEQASTGGKSLFTPLEWTKYTDLEQLLQVDPIHEVDEAGWPSQG